VVRRPSPEQTRQAGEFATARRTAGKAPMRISQRFIVHHGSGGRYRVRGGTEREPAEVTVT
jgi:hypothetical protein